MLYQVVEVILPVCPTSTNLQRVCSRVKKKIIKRNNNNNDKEKEETIGKVAAAGCE